MIKVCKFCNNEFVLKIKTPHSVVKYCSVFCQRKYNDSKKKVYEPMLLICKLCNKEFLTKPKTNIKLIKCCSSKCTQKLWYLNNYDKKVKQYLIRKSSGRLKDLLRKYNITLERYNELLNKQNGVCAICKSKETYTSSTGMDIKRLAIDHDHKTGKVRGLLCQKCNVGLGHFKDESKLLIKASEYLINNE